MATRPMSANQRDRLLACYDFLEHHMATQETFDPLDLAEASSLAVSTIKTYATKFWRHWIVREDPGYQAGRVGRRPYVWRVVDFHLNEAQFLAHMSQNAPHSDKLAASVAKGPLSGRYVVINRGLFDEYVREVLGE